MGLYAKTDQFPSLCHSPQTASSSPQRRETADVFPHSFYLFFFTFLPLPFPTTFSRGSGFLLLFDVRTPAACSFVTFPFVHVCASVVSFVCDCRLGRSCFIFLLLLFFFPPSRREEHQRGDSCENVIVWPCDASSRSLYSCDNSPPPRPHRPPPPPPPPPHPPGAALRGPTLRLPRISNGK